MWINIEVNEVVVFDDTWQRASRSSDGLRPEIQLPDMLAGAEVGFRRKFVTIESQSGLRIVFGPVLRADNYYSHRQIGEAAGLRGASDDLFRKVCRGGFADIVYRENKWNIRFYGQSGEFGVFHAGLEEDEVVETLARILHADVIVEREAVAAADYPW